MPLQIGRQLCESRRTILRENHPTLQSAPSSSVCFAVLSRHGGIHEGSDLCSSLIKSTPMVSIRRRRWRETLTRESFLASLRQCQGLSIHVRHRPNNSHYCIAAAGCGERLVQKAPGRPVRQLSDVTPGGGGSSKEGKFRIGDLGGQDTIPWHTKIWTRPMILSVEVLQHGSGCRLSAEIRIFTRALTTCMICISSNAFFIDTSCCKMRCSGGLPNTREPYFLDPMRAETVGVQDNGDVR